jgi:putative peptidoglycan lipid II flippase
LFLFKYFLTNSAVKNHLFKSTLVVSSMTTISRVFGLVRDIVIASMFGPGMGVDAFIVAFRIPNFLRRLFAEGGFSQAFVPVLSEYKEQRSPEEVRALVDQTSATLGLSLLAVTIIGVVAAPALVSLFALGWFFGGEHAKLALAGYMLRITFPYLLLISLTAFAGGILNTYRRFAVPAFTPVLLNISLISCAVWLAPAFPDDRRVVALAWGVVIAGIVQLLFQFPFLQRLGMLPRPALNRDREGVQRIIKLLIPTLFAISITQINLLVDTLIASFLVTGSISWLYFSDRMVEFPLGIFGIALATVILPSLSAHHAKGSGEDYRKTMDWALRWVVMIALPAAAGLALLAQPVLIVMFQYREFSPHDVDMAGRSLMAYAAGLPGFILIKVLSTGFFSRQDTKTPVKIGVVAMLSNVVLNLALVVPLAHAGLALATSMAAYVNAGLLFASLVKRGHYRTEPGWLRYLCGIALALAVMAILLGMFAPNPGIWLAWGIPDRVIHLAFWIGAGAGCYMLALYATGIRPHRMTSHP